MQARLRLASWNDREGAIVVTDLLGRHRAAAWGSAASRLAENGSIISNFDQHTEKENIVPSYYIDASFGDDRNAGTSPQAAWKTIGKVNAAALKPGDAVAFKRGEVWREQLRIRASGQPGTPITFCAYGPGAPPRLTGATALTAWEPVAGGVYRAVCTVRPNQVFANLDRLSFKAGKKDVLAAGQWDYLRDAGRQYVYLKLGTPPKSAVVEASALQTCCTTEDCSYVTITDIHFDQANEHNLFLTETSRWTSNVIIRNCIISRAYIRGLYHWDLEFGSDDFLIENNEIFDCGGFGLSWTRFANGGLIRNNRVYRNGALSTVETGNPDHRYHGGIAIFGNQVDVSNVIIEHNLSYENGRRGQPDTGGAGIWVDECAGGNVVRYNTVRDNAGCGIIAENIPQGGEIYCNLVYNNGHGVDGGAFGLFLSRGVRNWRVFNNTLYGNNEGIVVADFLGTGDPRNNIVKNNIAVGSARRNLRVEPTGVNNTLSHNCFGNP